MKRLEQIKEKITLLKSLDSRYSIFGASKHRYKFNPVLEKSKIQAFEQKFNISLPEEYKQFLTQIGDGGMGPGALGLEAFANALSDDLDSLDDVKLNPALPFLHTEAWNLDFENIDNLEDDEYEEEREKLDEIYFDSKHVNGLMRISNYGCGIYFNIVVNGLEFGNIWVDDRCSDHGIYPYENTSKTGRFSFFDWYEEWLDVSILQLNTQSI